MKKPGLFRVFGISIALLFFIGFAGYITSLFIGFENSTNLFTILTVVIIFGIIFIEICKKVIPRCKDFYEKQLVKEKIKPGEWKKALFIDGLILIGCIIGLVFVANGLIFFTQSNFIGSFTNSVLGFICVAITYGLGRYRKSLLEPLIN